MIKDAIVEREGGRKTIFLVRTPCPLPPSRTNLERCATAHGGPRIARAALRQGGSAGEADWSVKAKNSGAVISFIS